MSSVTDVFRDCHRLRRHARDLQNEIDEGPRVRKDRQAWLAGEEALQKEAHDAIRRLKLKLKDDEGSLKQTEQHLDKLETRAMQVTTMKEMEATKHEKDIALGKKADLEDAILAGITEIEERTAKLPRDDQRWADAKKEFAEFEAEAKERYERIVEDLALTTAKLAEKDALIPAEVKGTYDRLVKTHGPDGLAALKVKVCQQCRASVTDQQLFELNRGKFFMCPRCGRILYPDA
jgi:predicted  nucleic acid-binding Zn-ribbon protein